MIRNFIILPHIEVQNANALSSPYTIGFPAMTAWLGVMHALQRHLNQTGSSVQFNTIGIISHRFNLQTYKGTNDFVYSIVGTGNPLNEKGERSPFIEEARSHLDVSLILECKNLGMDHEGITAQIHHILMTKMKIAAGDIQSLKSPYIINLDDSDKTEVSRLLKSMMPGYALIERRELMIEAMKTETDAIDALIDYLAIHNQCEIKIDDDQNEKILWSSQRKSINGRPSGWLVPIATGFHGVSDISEAKNQRDPDIAHRFAESIVTLGEFKMPHRFTSIDQILWRYNADLENDLYLCEQNINAMVAIDEELLFGESEFD